MKIYKTRKTDPFDILDYKYHLLSIIYINIPKEEVHRRQRLLKRINELDRRMEKMDFIEKTNLKGFQHIKTINEGDHNAKLS